jgi:hypothetical protein
VTPPLFVKAPPFQALPRMFVSVGRLVNSFSALLLV